MQFATVNPATNVTLKTFDNLTKAQTMDAVGVAHEAFKTWRHTSFAQRKAIMLRFSGLMRERIDDLSKLMTLEMGKRLAESKGEVQLVIAITDYYANNAEAFLADEKLDVRGGDAVVRYTPIGALLGIMPWNFPFYQLIRFVAPTLMAGNTVLMKHAENVPQCALVFESLLAEAGLPKGVYTNLFIPIEFVEKIIADKRIAGVSLTGSERAGSAVGANAGKSLKKAVLELGGNDAFIVLEDADLDAAVQMAVISRMVSTGQACVAAKRFIVVQAVADAFMSRFKAAMSTLKLGDPMDSDTQVGPLSSERAAQLLEKQVQSAIKAGATVVLGGDRPKRDGAYFNPTILTDVAPDAPTFDQELFGPVATVYVVKDEAAAIELANHSSYGLGGSVYTSDVERGRRVADQIDTGMMFINQPTSSAPDLPFGGTKGSGFGRELSKEGIHEFINKKLIYVPTTKKG